MVARGYVHATCRRRAQRRLDGRAAGVRRRPAPAGRGREDAPGLRHRRRPVRRVGLPRRRGARRGDSPHPAPLRRRAVEAGRRRQHGRPQAGLAARPVPRPARGRHGGAEPGRAAVRAQAPAQPPQDAAARRGLPPAGPHPGGYAAGAPRPGSAGAGLRHRPARRGAGLARHGERGLRRRGGAGGGEGPEDPGGPDRRARPGRAGPLPRPRPAGPGQRRRTPGTVPVQVGPAPVHVGRAPAPARLDPARGAGGRGVAALAAPLVRHPSAGRRGRFAGHSGAFGPLQPLHDAGLHSSRVSAPEGCVRSQPPSGLTGEGTVLETNVKAIELKDRWRRYRGTGDERARERLVVAYSPLVKYVAGRMASGLPTHVEEADLISYGLIGLISAIERFDIEREIKFETYAIPRIRGAIIDELRALDWVPRSVRARARQIERANVKLEHKFQRPPTDEEMAAELEIDLESFQDALIQISNSTIAALDELWTVSDSSGDQVSLLDTLQDPAAPDPARAADATDLKDRVADAIARLPEREKLVIALYYYENLTLREIGEVLGVTESRVSQLHTKAVLRLRSHLSEEELAED